MAGTVSSHWMFLRSNANPGASDVASGVVALGTDGSSIYMTTAAGVTTAINGAAVQKDINLTDNAASEFQVRQASDKYIEVSTTDGSETLVLGNTGIAALATTMLSDTLTVTTTAAVAMTAGTTLSIDSGTSTTVAGTLLYVGEQNSVDPVHIANGGAREVNLSTVQGTVTRVRGADSTLVMDTNGVAVQVKDGEELSIRTAAGHTILDTDFATTDDITVGDVGAFAGQQLILDVATVQANNDVAVTGTVTANGNIIANGSSNLVLQGGGDITDGSNTALTVSATGQITRLGTSAAPTTNHVLTWNGTEWLSQAAPGGGATNLSGLSDVATLSPSGNDLLQYNSSTSVFEAVTPASVVGALNIGALANVSGSAATVTNQILVWSGSSWALSTGALGGNGLTGWKNTTDNDPFWNTTAAMGTLVLEPGYRYEANFVARVTAINGTVTGLNALYPAVRLTDGGSVHSIFAGNTGITAADCTANTMISVTVSFLVLEKPGDVANVYIIPSGSLRFRHSSGAANEGQTAILGWDPATQAVGLGDTGVAVQVAKTQVTLQCGVEQASGNPYSGSNNLEITFVGAWTQSFPALAVTDGDSGGNHPT